MNVWLLYQDKESDQQQPPPWNAKDLMQDLELDTLFHAMAADDDYLLELCRRIILESPANDIPTIIYRQDILKDCRQNGDIITQLYAKALEGLEVKRKNIFGIFSSRPSSILSGSTGMMKLYVDVLRDIRNLATANSHRFVSAGFSRFFKMLEDELTEDYLDTILVQLNDLKLRDGVLMSAQLGRGNKGTRYMLHRFREDKLPWYKRIFPAKPAIYTFHIHPRDESGARALAALTDNAIDNVANDLAQSCDHVFNFFSTLRYDLAFYIGCMNLEKQLMQIGMPVSFPVPVAATEGKQSFAGLYDACLALSMKRGIVRNDLDGDGKNPVIITGANQGGKSTFLRSIGIAQLMMQSGMYIPADHGKLSICDCLVTHFKREEDAEMKSGKFDEELSRMNSIADRITPFTLILFNESFASTNELEGTEIAEQIVRALIENGTRVFFVSHLYQFAHNLQVKLDGKALFLRAERDADQKRTFKLKAGEPLKTSYGMDLYDKIFNNN